MRHNEDKGPSATSKHIVSPAVLDTKEQKIIQCQSISVFIQLSSCDGTGLCVETHSRYGMCVGLFFYILLETKCLYKVNNS